LLLFLGVSEYSLIQNILGGELDDKFNRLPNSGLILLKLKAARLTGIHQQ